MTTVKFSNVIKGSPLNHLVYTFGDGYDATTTDQTVYHNYVTFGDYTFTLQAFSDNSSSQSVSYPIQVWP